MKSKKTSISGVLLIQPDIFKDERGILYESYNQDAFFSLGINDSFVQDTRVRSYKGNIRGLHYQYLNPQAKLVSVTSGKMFDVVVDLRVGSTTFGKHFTVELSAELPTVLYIPKGCAHGYTALTDFVDMEYKFSVSYDPKDQYGVYWDDPNLDIKWPINSPLLSEKDKILPLLTDIPKTLLF